MAAAQRTKAERICVRQSGNFPAGWLTRCCQKPDSGPEASWQRLHSGCLRSWLARGESVSGSSPAQSHRQTLKTNSRRRKQTKKQNCVAPHQPGSHMWVVQERPGIGGLRRVISGSCRLKFRFAPTAGRLRRTQIVCSAAALVSSLFIRVDQSRLFAIWVITHHAHLMELRLLYIL